MGEHIVNGKFQSDKYPTCPPGKVPLSTDDPMAQDLLWEYARRRRVLDAAFSDDAETCLKVAGFDPNRNLHDLRAKMEAENARLREALTWIERWFGEFPATGRTWPDGIPISYAAQFGSNGERDFMREIARTALAPSEPEPKPKPIPLSPHALETVRAILPSAQRMAARMGAVYVLDPGVAEQLARRATEPDNSGVDDYQPQPMEGVCYDV